MKISRSKTLDDLIELIAWLLNIGHALYVWRLYAGLPARLPIHFNLQGNPDAFGHKMHIWLLPIISIMILTVLTLLEKLKYRFNYLSPVSPENASTKYGQAIRLIRALKLAVTGIFLYITIQTVKLVDFQYESLDFWFVIIPMLLVPFYFIFAARTV